jgi:glyoxylase-like metal-dependent hydrolase (beta-lactamase superfamily II)
VNPNRRRFLTTSSLALAAATVDLSKLFAQTGQAPPPVPQTSFNPLRGTVGYFTGQGGTIGYHISKSGVVVIDAQMPATAKVCLDGINERDGGRLIDVLVNTHHHADHTGGNPVFKASVKKILAHANVPNLQRAAAARQAAARPDAPVPEVVVANATFTNTWEEDIGGERMALKYYGPAHTSGDAVVTFQKANIVHMGDLVFNRVHPYIDRPAGASIANWIKVLEGTVADHRNDTTYIFGHGSPRFGATGSRADLLYMRDYLTALLEFVRGEIKAGKPRDAIVTNTDPLKGFPDHGPLVERVLTPAYEELTA